jgi:hypothetical protein
MIQLDKVISMFSLLIFAHQNFKHQIFIAKNEFSQIETFASF